MSEYNAYRAAQKVLDYWYTMEFLGQDALPHLTREEEKALRNAEYDSKKYKFLHVIRPFSSKEKVTDAVREDQQRFHMQSWGNITVYVGKSKREDCVRKLAELLKRGYSRPEKNLDEIAWCSFQLNETGRYIEETFSLSKPIWALNYAEKSGGQIQEEFLNEKAYKNQIQKYEELLCRIDATEPFGIVKNKIKELYDILKNSFVNALETKESGSFYCLLEYQMFLNKEAEENWRDDTYRGLGADFYSNDLKMVQESLKNKYKSMQKPMVEALVKYIEAGYASFHPEMKWIQKFPWLFTREKYEDRESYRIGFWAKLLDIRSGSLGKWPSRFMPSLMQQAAINLFIHIGDTFYGDNIFSVNGPPGTGKTAMIKEIVAHNIVERAIVLADYTEPDEAFIECNFRYGMDKNNGYASEASHYYKLRDERVNNYGILVASSNNTAVENITKEFPMEKKIVGVMQENAGDGIEMKRQMGEIRELFSVEKSSSEEELYIFDSAKKGFYKEIYFSKYAKELLEEKEEVWGLISAPLGKRSNIHNFYWKVLYPLNGDFYSRRKIEDRLKPYRAARNRFLEQKAYVEKLQSELMFYCQAELDMRKAYIELTEDIQSIANRLVTLRSKQELYLQQEGELQKSLVSVKEDYQEHCAKLEKILWEYHSSQEQLQKANSLYEETLIGAAEVWGKVGIIRRIILELFFKKSANVRNALEQKYKAEAEQIAKSIELWKTHISEVENKKNIETEKYKKIEQERNRIEGDISKVQKNIGILQEEIECEQAQIDRKVIERKKRLDSYNELIKNRIDKAEETEKFIALNQTFIEKMLGGNKENELEAQTQNLWYTQHYNREREKLFFYALQMNREFVLASDCCRQNFLNLAMLWGERKKDNKKVIFHPEDRKNSMTPLIQTLFLLVPVISTTFASVGRFFGDIKEPGALGTLVIDEAGQAQPQFAIGALFRSRKAIVIGDPRQIEPIVSDELEILKEVFKENIYSAYKKKSISVQKLADYMNPYGIWSENRENGEEWLGCPLRVHRRCITPMYEISNEISYNNTMLQQTAEPTPEEEKRFCYENSRWINICGSEEGEKDHYVKAQGDKVLEILERAFGNSSSPRLFIITPFNTVKEGMLRCINQYLSGDKGIEGTESNLLKQKDLVKAWMYQNIGTVHSFQGKEADEVIFLLGCDKGKAAEGAIRWINTNLVNVAVTRAKYRLYVIGDFGAWRKSPYISQVKAQLDLYAIRALSSIEALDSGNREIVHSLVSKLPSAESFEIDTRENEDGDIEYIPETEDYLRELKTAGLLLGGITEEQLAVYGYTKEEFLHLNEQIRNYIEWGIKLHTLFYSLTRKYSIENLDASCCGILFCKAVELYMKDYFLEGLKKQLPTCSMMKKGKRIPLQEMEKQDVTLGTFGSILRKDNNIVKLANFFKEVKMDEYTEMWWGKFLERLSRCTICRNACCHSNAFEWDKLNELRDNMFFKEKTGKEPLIEGVLKYGKVGERMAE